MVRYVPFMLLPQLSTHATVHAHIPFLMSALYICSSNFVHKTKKSIPHSMWARAVHTMMSTKQWKLTETAFVQPQAKKIILSHPHWQWMRKQRQSSEAMAMTPLALKSSQPSTSEISNSSHSPLTTLAAPQTGNNIIPPTPLP